MSMKVSDGPSRAFEAVCVEVTGGRNPDEPRIVRVPSTRGRGTHPAGCDL